MRNPSLENTSVIEDYWLREDHPEPRDAWRWLWQSDPPAQLGFDPQVVCFAVRLLNRDMGRPSWARAIRSPTWLDRAEDHQFTSRSDVNFAVHDSRDSPFSS
jgi:hypothetical protein